MYLKKGKKKTYSKKSKSYTKKSYKKDYTKDCYNLTKYHFKYNSIKSYELEIPNSQKDKLFYQFLINPLHNMWWTSVGGLDTKYAPDLHCHQNLFIRGGKWSCDIKAEGHGGTNPSNNPVRCTVQLGWVKEGNHIRSVVEEINGEKMSNVRLDMNTTYSKQVTFGKYKQSFELNEGDSKHIEFKIPKKFVDTEKYWQNSRGLPVLFGTIDGVQNKEIGTIKKTLPQISIKYGYSLIFVKLYSRHRCPEGEDIDDKDDNTMNISSSVRGGLKRAKTEVSSSTGPMNHIPVIKAAQQIAEDGIENLSTAINNVESVALKVKGLEREYEQRKMFASQGIYPDANWTPGNSTMPSMATEKENSEKMNHVLKLITNLKGQL